MNRHDVLVCRYVLEWVYKIKRRSESTISQGGRWVPFNGVKEAQSLSQSRFRYWVNHTEENVDRNDREKRVGKFKRETLRNDELIRRSRVSRNISSQWGGWSVEDRKKKVSKKWGNCNERRRWSKMKNLWLDPYFVNRNTRSLLLMKFLDLSDLWEKRDRRVPKIQGWHRNLEIKSQKNCSRKIRPE